MPPRYAYWTILIDNQPTAFRAHQQEDLLPTLAQLRRTNADVVLKWFARGRVWDSPEAEREAQRRPREERSREWRPGGVHKDPRDRFKKKDKDKKRAHGESGERPRWPKPGGPPGAPRSDRPQWNKFDRPPSGPPRSDRPQWNKSGRPPSGPPRGDRPQWNKSGRPPSGPPRGDRPQWNKSGRPPSGPRGDRPQWNKPGRPPSGPPRDDRPQWDKPGRPGGNRPWDKSGKPPAGAPRGDRPPNRFGKPHGAKPWHGKPSGPPRGDRPPWQKSNPRDRFSREGGRPFPRRDRGDKDKDKDK
jgi:hypothetical protein